MARRLAPWWLLIDFFCPKSLGRWQGSTNRIFTARKREGNVFSLVCLSARLSTCVKI